tara:strand:+ start:1027 stop:1719 length:693 start_codon:yes stop_codon:yes gene_type:complete
MFTKKKTYLYLEQAKELYGDVLYTSQKKSSDRLKDHSAETKNQNIKILNDYEMSICACQKCQLGKSRSNFVFGSGDPRASLMLIGEAPGEHEDKKGEPFVGRSGDLLDKILSAININRESGVFISNVLKCRPPDNRNPLNSEINKCEPYLVDQINIIKPRLIVALGKVAGKTLTQENIPLKAMREKTYYYNEIPARVTYHPAALLRDPSLKIDTWEDFKWIKSFLNNYDR